jgi:hypothetical protein
MAGDAVSRPFSLPIRAGQIFWAKPLEQFPFRSKRFAGGILLSCKERITERSGATVKILDAAGQKNVPARRVRFGDVLRRYTA